jgi:hypothetical protein
MGMLAALLGCTPIEPVEQPGAPLLVIEPSAVDFGAVPIGQTATASVALRNDGDVAIEFDGGVTSSDVLLVDDAGPFALEPGDEQVRTVSWTATTIYGLNEHLDFVVGDVPAARVPVTGSSSWGALEVSTSPINFPRTNVGCEAWVDLTVRNEGTGPEALTAIAVTDPAFFVTSPEGAELDLPLTVDARSEQVVRLHFVPAAAEPSDGTLVIESELTPAFAAIDLHGEGRPVQLDTRTWTVEHDEAVTGILNVNEGVVNDEYGFADRWVEFLPVFLESLLEAPEAFRFAIVMNENGQVHGHVPYIDESFSLEDAIAAADLMVEGASQHGDNDLGLETCFQGMLAAGEWLLDGSPWSDSNLNLVVVNFDVEQSPSDAAYYVDQYLEYKDAGDLAVHGIAGDVPSGCNLAGAKKWFAAPSVNLRDATVATGGAFLSICDSDWTRLARTLAWRFTAPYVLDGAPWITSIEVFVDGDPVSSGWSYDDATHEITFDEGSAPDEGAELRVDYARCD